jgi:hypothetical protein
MNSILSLPNEIIYEISRFLRMNDLYNFSRTCKDIYYNIWEEIDLWKLSQLIFYGIHINLYCCFWSDRDNEYIKMPYIFRYNNNSHSFGFRYYEEKLYIKFLKISSTIETDNELEFIEIIEKLGYLVEYVGMERNYDRYQLDYSIIREYTFCKESQLDIHGELLDWFDQEVKEIVDRFRAYSHYLSDEQYQRIEYYMIQVGTNQEFYMDDIQYIYWINVWYTIRHNMESIYPNDYSYKKSWEIREISIEKQKSIASQINRMIKGFNNKDIMRLSQYLYNHFYYTEAIKDYRIFW